MTSEREAQLLAVLRGLREDAGLHPDDGTHTALPWWKPGTSLGFVGSVRYAGWLRADGAQTDVRTVRRVKNDDPVVTSQLEAYDAEHPLDTTVPPMWKVRA